MIFEKIRDRILDAAQSGVKDACTEVQEMAKSLCPVQSGKLKGSIGLETTGLSGAVYAGCDYGVYVELGSADKAAQPFLYPAFAGVKGSVSRMIGERL